MITVTVVMLILVIPIDYLVKPKNNADGDDDDMRRRLDLLQKSTEVGNPSKIEGRNNTSREKTQRLVHG